MAAIQSEETDVDRTTVTDSEAPWKKELRTPFAKSHAFRSGSQQTMRAVRQRSDESPA
jgi:hypothetical protein